MIEQVKGAFVALEILDIPGRLEALENTPTVINSRGGSSLTADQYVASITGTANQVLANGTSVTPQTGAVTLTLPQSIATTSTPTFGTLTLTLPTDTVGLKINANINQSVNLTEWYDPESFLSAYVDAFGTGSFANLLSSNATLSGLTAGRVVYTGTGGLLSTEAALAYNATTDELSLLTSGSAAGLLIGGDAKIYRDIADVLRTPDSLRIDGALGINASAPTTGRVQVTGTHTSLTAESTTVNITATHTVNSPDTTTGRMWGLQFEATQAGTGIFNDGATFGATGIQGLAQFTGSGSSVGVSGIIGVARNTSSGTLTRAAGLVIPMTGVNTGGGHLTNLRPIDISWNTVFTATNQTRMGIRIGAGPTNHGSFAGSITGGIWFNSSSRGVQDGILWGTGGDTNLYSSATDTLKTDDSFVVGGSMTVTGLTAGGVVFTGTGGLLSYDADLLFDGNTLSMPNATTSATGIVIGSAGRLYQSVAQSGSGGTLINPTVVLRYTNFYLQTPVHTSTTASENGLYVEKVFTPTADSSGRIWGLKFLAQSSGAFNLTDSTSSVAGVEGTVVINATGTTAGATGMILFNSFGANSTTTRFAAADYYGADVSGSATVGATVTESSGAIIRLPRSSGNTSLGNVVTNYGIQFRGATWSGTGHITTQYLLSMLAGQSMNAVTANSQTRIFLNIPDMPTPGAFTSTVIQGIQFNNGTRAIRNGIAWGTTAYLWESGAGTLTVAGDVAGTATANITLAGSGVLTAPGSVVTPLVNPASGVALVIRGTDEATPTTVTVRGGNPNGMAGTGGLLILRGGTSGSASGASGGVSISAGTIAGASTAGSVTIYQSDASTKAIEVNNTGIGFFGTTPAGRQTYTVSNVTTDRSYDANATTVDEIADTLGTLIADLRSLGLVA